MKRLLLCAVLLLGLCALPHQAWSDSAISALPDGGATIQGTDEIPIARGGSNYRISPNDILQRGLPFTGMKETVVAGGTCSTSYNVDPTAGTMVNLTLNGACQLGVTNLAAGHSFTVKLTQSSTVAPTFTSAYKWPLGVTPTFSTSATKYDTIVCMSFDGSTAQCLAQIDVR